MSDSDVIKVLKGAKKLLRRKGGWTRGAAARNADKYQVDSTHGDAVSSCLVGASYRAADDLKLSILDAERAVQSLNKAVGFGGRAVAFNDAQGRKKCKVLALIDKAIKALEVA